MRPALWSVIAVCLLYACITDCRTRQVYNFTWWIAGTAAALLLSAGNRITAERLLELALFTALQCGFFSKMYGKADCYAFSVCAAAAASEGIGLAGFLNHMLLAFALLAVVQGIRRNIGADGNLKRPVPFLPYITLAFWGLLWYYNSC